ncbi:MAG: DNA alkylation repair protein [Mesorhizobium sp.]|nr:DNA alkylation repair protein [Mesorhizobium sp.]MBL8577952.1 DNA alkylation repair protein [Mesorhizobium sp.]
MAGESIESAPALKEILNRERLTHIARETAGVWPAFDRKRFMRLATEGLDDLGIMHRMRLVATSLYETLPEDFAKAVPILEGLAPRLGHAFTAISLSEYVALYGQRHFDRSLDALKMLTRFGSSEFAIRHFLVADFDRTIAVMRGWADNENEHVRRLASEGSRPRLPWSFQLKNLIVDPSPTGPILDALKADPSLYVRKSVANHLNDIGKDHPDRLVDRVSSWGKSDRNTAWIVRHALRTLIKKGDPLALALIGTTGKAEVKVLDFCVDPTKINLGDRITTRVKLASTLKTVQRLVVDYAVHYPKKNGLSRKVFKLRELDLAPNATVDLAISQTVKDFTTRKHSAGFHRVELMVNGEALAESGFELRIQR